MYFIFPSKEGIHNALAPQDLTSVHLEFTSSCNLKCTYCAVSQPGYRGQKLASQILESAVLYLKTRNPGMVFINGHGETTIVKNWENIALKLAAEFPVGITSNLSRTFSDTEARAIAQFKMLTVSLDTVDNQLAAQLRRGLNLAILKDNLKKIRKTTKELNIKGPDLILSAGIFDANVFKLRRLAFFALFNDFKHVVFWNYRKYPDLTDALNVYPISNLETDKRKKALREIKLVSWFLRKLRISVEVVGDFTHTLDQSS